MKKNELELLKQKIEESRDEARDYAEKAKRDREQYSFYFGRQMAFVECVNEIKAILLDCLAKSLEENEDDNN